MFFEQYNPIVKKLNAVESAKTLRKIGLFGSWNEVIEFEWPTKAKAEAFKSDYPIKLVSFNWKERKVLGHE